MTSIPFGSNSNATRSPDPATARAPDVNVMQIPASTLAFALVARVQRSLRRVVHARAAVIGVATACALAALLILAARQWPSARLLSAPVCAGLALVAGMVAAVVHWRRASRITPLRTALWIEERTPAGFSLVTLIEQNEHDARVRDRLASAFLDAVGGSARAEDEARDGVRVMTGERLRDPAAFGALALGLLLWLVLVPLNDQRGSGAATTSRAPADKTQSQRRAAPIGVWSVRIEPPAYSGLRVQESGDADEVHALRGSRLVVTGTGALPSSIAVRSLVEATETSAGTAVVPPPPIPQAALASTAGGWRATLSVPASPLEMRLSRGGATRLLLVDGYADSIPRVGLQVPARDSVLRRATGSLALQAGIHDDLGLASASFELIVSSGEGERFTARTVRVAATRFAGARDATLRGALDLDSMQLGPGDIVHVRAVARDANPAAERESGSSETRTLRVARPAEYDSVSVEPAPPPEVDKSLLSQRMLLMLTEKLEQRRARIPREMLQSESRNLARDQARLRLAVGDAVFQRLSGESSAEHAHSVGDGHDHGVEAVGGKLAMPGGVSATGILEEGDDSPVIGINKPLLEAYNAMWDAGRALELADTKGAIPHMRVALAAIERARAASRLYLRGKPPVVILDLDKIRLAGKDTGATNARSLRAAVPVRARVREARLLAAASLAVTDARAARDTLAVLRLEALADAPDFASALAAVIELLRSGGDGTDAFVRARRVLGGVARAPEAAWSRVGPP